MWINQANKHLKAPTASASSAAFKKLPQQSKQHSIILERLHQASRGMLTQGTMIVTEKAAANLQPMPRPTHFFYNGWLRSEPRALPRRGIYYRHLIVLIIIIFFIVFFWKATAINCTSKSARTVYVGCAWSLPFFLPGLRDPRFEPLPIFVVSATGQF